MRAACQSACPCERCAPASSLGDAVSAELNAEAERIAAAFVTSVALGLAVGRSRADIRAYLNSFRSLVVGGNRK